MKKYIQKFVGYLLILCLILGIAGCGNSTGALPESTINQLKEEIRQEIIQELQIAATESESDETYDSGPEQSLEQAAEYEQQPEKNDTEEVQQTDSDKSYDTQQGTTANDEGEVLQGNIPAEDEYYYDVQNVVNYIDYYGHLPYNYITKKEARALGWEGGSVEQYKEDAAIGGDHFSNAEGNLPKGNYTECDIDTYHYKNRGSRRLVFSDDGRYYYTKNHYEDFTEVFPDY